MEATRQDYREHILDVAGELFYRDGIHATGIETVIARAEVARMTLYRHFPSKNILVEGVLRRHLAGARERLAAIAGGPDRDAEARLDELFDAIDGAVGREGYFGCPLINAAAEYSDPAHPFHLLATEYKRLFRDAVAQIVAGLDAGDSDALTGALVLLVEGTYVVAQTDPDRRDAGDARAAARILISHHRRSP